LDAIQDRIPEFEIGLGMMKVSHKPSVLCISGIGSCVGLAMRDDVTLASGLAHILLPASKETKEGVANPGKYSDTAVPALVDGLVAHGAIVGHIMAKLVGGGRVLENGFDGMQNVECARSALGRRGIGISAEDVGGTYGRSMRFDTASGNIQVRRFRQYKGISELKDTITI